jgi:hypothetical protein
MVLLAPLIALVLLVSVVYADIHHQLIITWHILPVLLLYPIWGIIQQFLMLGIISEHVNSLFHKKANRYLHLLTVSAFFSLIHYPDIFLMLFTFFLEIVFLALYLKWKNLWAIGISHGVIATFLLMFVLERNLWLELFSGY